MDLPEVQRVYELRCENIVMAAGGPMGSKPTRMWSQLFKDPADAKRFAETDNRTEGRPDIVWSESTLGWRSQDLRSVQYVITTRTVV